MSPTWNDLEYVDKIPKLEEEIEELENKIENFYSTILQFASIIIAIFTLVIGNLLSFSSLIKKLETTKFIGLGALINGVILLAIWFLLVLVRILFFKRAPLIGYLFALIPGSLFVLGIIFLRCI